MSRGPAGSLLDPAANPAMGRKPVQNLRGFKRVTAPIDGVFPMLASASAGNHPDRLSAPSAVTCGPATAALPGITFLPRNAMVESIFRRIRPLFETQRKGPMAAARKTADGGIAQDRSGAGLMFRAFVGGHPCGGGVSGGRPEPAPLARRPGGPYGFAILPRR